MKRRSIARALLVAAAAASPAMAADGVWTLNASGQWNSTTTGNWQDGVVADGANSIADFSQVNITASTTVTLTEPRVIGALIFGDTDTTANAGSNWVLSNNNSAANTLTLAGTAPSITANALATNSLVRISAVLDGTNGLTKSGVTVVALNAANTYTGGTTVASGSLRAEVNGALGTGAIVVENGGRLQTNGTNLVIGNNITLKGGTGLEVVGGFATFNGDINLEASSTYTGTTGTASVLFGGNLNLGTNQFNISPGGRPVTISGALVGSGTLNVNATNATVTITQDNSETFSGTVSISRSTLALGTNGAIGTGTLAFGVNDQPSAIRSTDTTSRTISNVMTLVGANSNSVYVFGSTNANFNGGLNFTNTTNINVGATRKFEVHNQTTITAGFASTGAGRGLILQNSTGTLTLKGDSTYVSGTTISAATLLVGVNGVGSLGNTAVTVASAGALGGSGSIAGTVGVAGRLTPGNAGVGTLTSGALALAAGSKFAVEYDAAANQADQMVVATGGVTIDPAATLELINLVNFQGAYEQSFVILRNDSGAATTGTFANFAPGAFDNLMGLAGTIQYDFNAGGSDGLANDVLVTFTSVPEPGSMSLIGLAAVALLKRRRR